MPLTKKKPSIDQRLAQASASQNVAIAAFEDAATRLDEAQAAHEEIAAEARAEAERLLAVANTATDNAKRSARVASRVRSLTA